MSSQRPTPGMEATRFPPLTRGFEFEFLIPFRFDKVDGYQDIVIPEGKHFTMYAGCIVLPRANFYHDVPEIMFADARNECHHILYGLLTMHGIDCNDPGSVETYDTLPPEPGHPNAQVAGAPVYYRWNIKSDASLGALWADHWSEDAGPYQLADVEIVSPPLLDNDPDADKQIKTVLEIIQNVFLCFTPKCCGLHIHIGQGNVFFDADAAKQVAALFLCVERLFNSLHPGHRRLDPFNHPSIRNWTNAGAGMTAEEANNPHHTVNTWDEWTREYEPEVPTPRATLQRGVEALLGTTSVPAVIKMMTAPDRPAYTFDNLLNHVKPTIECRQGAGTLNPEWALHWSHILAAVVDLGRRANGTLFWLHLVPTLSLIGENGEASEGAMTIDAFVRNVLKLPETANYIARTTPHERCYPPLKGDQVTWRRNPELIPQIKPAMLP